MLTLWPLQQNFYGTLQEEVGRGSCIEIEVDDYIVDFFLIIFFITQVTKLSTVVPSYWASTVHDVHCSCCWYCHKTIAVVNGCPWVRLLCRI